MGRPSEEQFLNAGRKLLLNMACGPDGVPGEFLKAILKECFMAV